MAALVVVQDSKKQALCEQEEHKNTPSATFWKQQCGTFHSQQKVVTWMAREGRMSTFPISQTLGEFGNMQNTPELWHNSTDLSCICQNCISTVRPIGNVGFSKQRGDSYACLLDGWIASIRWDPIEGISLDREFWKCTFGANCHKKLNAVTVVEEANTASLALQEIPQIEDNATSFWKAGFLLLSFSGFRACFQLGFRRPDSFSVGSTPSIQPATDARRPSRQICKGTDTAHKARVAERRTKNSLSAWDTRHANELLAGQTAQL